MIRVPLTRQSATPDSINPSELRHALRTPLNQIAGYTDMLIEDLSCNVLENDPPAVCAALEDIRLNGLTILEVLQQELPADLQAVGPEQLSRLRERMRPHLDAIAGCVGRLVSDERIEQAGVSLADVLRIGSAAAELVEFTRNDGRVWTESHPISDGKVEPEAMGTGDVLVVDDNPGNRDLLSRMLERSGYRVFPAADGESALAQLAARSFDLIMLDLMMPGMDGIAVLKRIKAEPAWRDISVVMLSALDEASRVIQCLGMGAEDYVVKPFDPVLLLARLRSTLERSRLRVAATARARELEDAYEKLRQNEKRLQESEERLRWATEAAEVGIWYYYPNENRVLMTAGCKRLFGLPDDPHPLSYRQMLEQIHPEDRERADAETKRALDLQSEYDTEFRVVWPGSAVHWISLRGLARGTGEQHELRLAGVALDVTGRRQAEEAVRQTHKLESIGLLAGGIAHDFNNLLTGIIGSASFVMDNMPPDDPNMEMLTNVIHAGERAADLTKQLLAYSGKGKFTIGRLHLSKLVEDIAVLLRTSIPRTIAIERHLAEDLPSIEGDSTQMQQIVMNLVINGAEAIGSEGVVRIETGLTVLPPGGRENFVYGAGRAAGEYVFLEVRDTGSGMDREIVNKIFDPFFTTKFTGRGLGLAAVFGIVRGHEGALEVISAPGAGSTFRVYFPLAPGESARKPNKKGPAKVLFVDDEAVVRLMGRTALERAGFEVLLAEKGEDALRMLEGNRNEIALAIVDLTLPGWSGFETLHRMRQISPTLRTIISSGYGEDEVRARYPYERIGVLLNKPYSASSLVARVKELLK